MTHQGHTASRCQGWNLNPGGLNPEVRLLTVPFPTCPLSQGLSQGQWPCSPLQLVDLLGQDALLIPGQVPATLQLALFFPGKKRPQRGDRKQGWCGYPSAPHCSAV